MSGARALDTVSLTAQQIPSTPTTINTTPSYHQHGLRIIRCARKGKSAEQHVYLDKIYLPSQDAAMAFWLKNMNAECLESHKPVHPADRRRRD